MRRAIDLDVLARPRSGGRMRLVGTIAPPPVIGVPLDRDFIRAVAWHAANARVGHHYQAFMHHADDQAVPAGRLLAADGQLPRWRAAAARPNAACSAAGPDARNAQ